MFIAVTMFLVSCEEHLDVPPVSSITSASYWQGENDAASYLTGIYAEYRGLTNTHLYSERRADLLENGPQAPLMANEFNHTLNVDVNGRNWRGFYEVIHHCNLLLSKMDELEIGDNDIRAQALSLRALTYFGLIKAFGDVPLNLEPTLSVPDEMLARTPVAQIVTQIKSDIDDAVDLFSTDAIGNRITISKPAALAAQADIYMWNGRVLGGGDSDINVAINAINAIEASGAATLLGNYADVFPVSNEKNAEILFSTYWEVDETGSNTMNDFGVRQDYLGGVDNIAIHYPDVPHSGNTGLNQAYFSAYLISLYDENLGDVRKAANTMEVRSVVDDVWRTNLIIKFIGTWDGVNRTYDNDLIQYRWADMLLLRAEANNSVGARNEGAALADLNLVRGRAGIGDYTGASDQASLEDEILKERARELFLENKRWEDLIRSGKVTEMPSYNAQRGDDMRYIYWPIDKDIMAQNDLLVQTPGY